MKLLLLLSLALLLSMAEGRQGEESRRLEEEKRSKVVEEEEEVGEGVEERTTGEPLEIEEEATEPPGLVMTKGLRKTTR